MNIFARIFSILLIKFNQKSKQIVIRILLLNSLILLIELFFNYWHAWSYTPFINKDKRNIVIYLAIYFILQFTVDAIIAEVNFFKIQFTIKRREDLYNYYTKEINYDKNNYTNMLLCQRLSDDLKQFFDIFISLGLDFIFNIIKIPIYLLILLKITNITILVVVIFFILIGNILSKKISNILTELDYILESKEAEFRRSLVRKFDEHQAFYPKVEDLQEINLQIAKKEKKLSYFQNIYHIFSSFLKYSFLMSLYLGNKISFSILAQASDAFKNLIKYSTFLLQNRSKIAKFLAIIKRIEEIDNLILKK